MRSGLGVMCVVVAVLLVFARAAAGAAQFEAEDPILLADPRVDGPVAEPFAPRPGDDARPGAVRPDPSGGPFVPPVGGAPSGARHIRRTWHAGCGLGAAFGAVPAVRPFLICHGDRRFSPHTLIGLTIRHDFLAAAVGSLGGVVRASRTRLELAACAAAGGLVACATASAGTLRVTTLDVYGSSHHWRFTPTLGGALGYAFDVASTLRMSALFGLDFSPDRPSLGVDGEIAYSVPLASPSLAIRLDWGHP